jgi:O-antigen/teichoic acid export membrane protein
MGLKLVSVPIVIRYLGLDGYGVWSVLMTMAAYMSLGSAGVKSAFQKYTAEATGTGDFERASRLITTGTAAVLLVSVLALIPIAIFSHVLASAVGVPPRFLDSATHAILLLAFIMVLVNAGSSYQAILMGAHRIDLQKKFNIGFTAVQVIVSVVLLYFGYGLLALAAVFGIAEIGELLVCYLVGLRIAPDVRIAPRYFSRSVIRELCTFAGSYQLVSMLEALFGMLFSVTVLKFYGAESSGVLAVASRLVGTAAVLQGSFLQAILSGGSLVYSSSSVARLRLFLVKSFKVTLGLSIVPLGFIGSFGTLMVLAWTGQTDPSFRGVLWILCVTSLFRSLSSVSRVLYRVSGGGLMDNVQLISMILVLFCFCLIAGRIGFLGIVAGPMLAQILGLAVIWRTLAKAFWGFKARVLLPELWRLVSATAITIAAASLAAHVGAQWSASARYLAVLRLGAVSLVALAVSGPALLLTGAVTRSEARTILGTLRGRVAVAA